MLLQIGQLLSEAGTQSTSIAYPLLVLALTGSAAKAGTVSFARTLPWALLALAAGVVAAAGGPLWIQIVVFAAVSVLLLVICLAVLLAIGGARRFATRHD